MYEVNKVYPLKDEFRKDRILENIWEFGGIVIMGLALIFVIVVLGFRLFIN